MPTGVQDVTQTFEVTMEDMPRDKDTGWPGFEEGITFKGTETILIRGELKDVEFIYEIQSVISITFKYADTILVRLHVAKWLA